MPRRRRAWWCIPVLYSLHILWSLSWHECPVASEAFEIDCQSAHLLVIASSSYLLPLRHYYGSLSLCPVQLQIWTYASASVAEFWWVPWVQVDSSVRKDIRQLCLFPLIVSAGHHWDEICFWSHFRNIDRRALSGCLGSRRGQGKDFY